MIYRTDIVESFLADKGFVLSDGMLPEDLVVILIVDLDRMLQPAPGSRARVDQPIYHQPGVVSRPSARLPIHQGCWLGGVITTYHSNKYLILSQFS